MRVFDYSIYIFFPSPYFFLRNYLSFEFRFALYCIGDSMFANKVRLRLKISQITADWLCLRLQRSFVSSEILCVWNRWGSETWNIALVRLEFSLWSDWTPLDTFTLFKYALMLLVLSLLFDNSIIVQHKYKILLIIMCKVNTILGWSYKNTFTEVCWLISENYFYITLLIIFVWFRYVLVIWFYCPS